VNTPASRFQLPAQPTVLGNGLRRWRGIGCLLAGICATLAPIPAIAHDSPEHVVEQLTADMHRDGQRPGLLCDRATQYRELGRLAEAEADLSAALAAEPGNVSAANDLARVQLHRGHPTNALATLDRAIHRAANAEDRSPLLLTRAEIRATLGEHKAALADCNNAFSQGVLPDLDWYLLRSQLQLRAGQPAAAVAGLKQGFEQTGNAVLEAEWIEALIDAGQPRLALERIEEPLAQSRWRSSWLLRRGRARLELGDTTRARGDLREAIHELDARLEAPRRDSALLLDRGLAHALLGEHAAARRDLEAAQSAGADPGTTWRLESRLAARP